MKLGDLIRLNLEFVQTNYLGPFNLSRESIGMVLGPHPEGGLSVLIEGRVISMYEYQIEVVNETR